MAKGWTKILEFGIMDNADFDRKKANQHFDILMRKTETLSLEKLKKEGEDLCIKKAIEENDLLDAYNAHKLKNKTAIRRAARIKKEREAKKHD